MKGTKINLAFGTEVIYEDADFYIDTHDKVGIVGVNGAGKTTLFHVLLHEQELDSGTISTGNSRIGYLPQEITIEDESCTVLEYLKRGRPINKLEAELNVIYKKLESAGTAEHAMLFKQMEKLQSHLESYDYYEADSILLHIIDRMGISSGLLDMPLNRLSGGQKSQIAFGRVLYSKSDILLLDEPTNHALKRMGQERALRLEKKRSMKQTRDRIYKRVKMDLRPMREGGGIPLEVEHLSFHYPNQSLLYRDLSFQIHEKERFLIVGENGAGKSTLLKLIMGIHSPDTGSIHVHPKTDVAYYAQELEQIDLQKTILENAWTDGYTEKQLRSVLSNFLFYADDIHKKAEILSPGEKARIALCKVLLQRANLLILDEPTNHLDPETQSIIGGNFHLFEGTIMVVSHNPWFVEQIGVNRVLILPSGRIVDYSRELLEYYYGLNSEEEL